MQHSSSRLRELFFGTFHEISYVRVHAVTWFVLSLPHPLTLSIASRTAARRLTPPLTRHTLFNTQGVYVSKKDDGSGGVECALIFDGETGFRLERLGGVVKGLKIARDEEDDDAGVGVGVGVGGRCSRLVGGSSEVTGGAGASGGGGGGDLGGGDSGGGGGMCTGYTTGKHTGGGGDDGGIGQCKNVAIHQKPAPRQDPTELEVMEAAAAAVAGEDWNGGKEGRAHKKARSGPVPMQTDEVDGGDCGGGGGKARCGAGKGGEGEGGGHRTKAGKKNGSSEPSSSFAQFVESDVDDSSSSSSSSSSSDDEDDEDDEDILAPLAEENDA